MFPYMAVPHCRQPPDDGLMCELLWSDPQPGKGRSPNKRGVGVAFGPDVTRAFLELNKLDLLVRSHEVLSPAARSVVILPGQTSMQCRITRLRNAQGLQTPCRIRRNLSLIRPLIFCHDSLQHDAQSQHAHLPWQWPALQSSAMSCDPRTCHRGHCEQKQCPWQQCHS